jgi:hypothetical protein
MAYGDVGLISGTDASNVVVSGTSWTASFQTGASYSGTNPLMESQADVKVTGGGDYLYARLSGTSSASAWAVDTPYTIKITEGGAADVHVYIDNVDIVSPNYFASTVSGGNMLQIKLTDFAANFGGGWSLDNLSVNGKLFDGSWSNIGISSAAQQPITFYVNLSGSNFQSAQFTAELHHDSNGFMPAGQDTRIQISSVAASVPEPSSFILVMISGIALLVLKKKPLRSS